MVLHHWPRLCLLLLQFHQRLPVVLDSWKRPKRSYGVFCCSSVCRRRIFTSMHIVKDYFTFNTLPHSRSRYSYCVSFALVFYFIGFSNRKNLTEIDPHKAGVSTALKVTQPKNDFRTWRCISISRRAGKQEPEFPSNQIRSRHGK